MMFTNVHVRIGVQTQKSQSLASALTNISAFVMKVFMRPVAAKVRIFVSAAKFTRTIAVNQITIYVFAAVKVIHISLHISANVMGLTFAKRSEDMNALAEHLIQHVWRTSIPVYVIIDLIIVGLLQLYGKIMLAFAEEPIRQNADMSIVELLIETFTVLVLVLVLMMMMMMMMMMTTLVRVLVLAQDHRIKSNTKR